MVYTYVQITFFFNLPLIAIICREEKSGNGILKQVEDGGITGDGSAGCEQEAYPSWG